MFKTAILLTVIFTIIIKVKSLQCYVCYDCLEVTDEYLTSCESLVSTTTTTSTSTAVPSTSTSTIPASTNSSTTTPTNTSTESSSTTAPVTSTSTEISSSSTTESNSTTTTTPATTTESTSSNTTTSTTSTEAQLNLAGENGKADISNECFQGKIQVNTTDVVIRGCAAGRTNETCESFGLTSCSFCSSDNCNSASAIQSSVVLLAVTLFIYMFRE